MDKYRIIQRVGNEKVRKFNQVFLVENKSTLQKAILKHVVKNKNVQAEESLRFESQLQFESERLPKVLDFYETENELFLYLAYIEDSKTITEFWDDLIPEEKGQFFKDLFTQFDQILIELGAKKLVHGDIKPSNILVKKEEENFHFYLIDFGLSFNYSNPPKRKVIFSLAYSAPELIANRLDLCDTRTDIYSLGIVLFQILTGKLPFTHKNPAVLTNLQLTYPIDVQMVQPKLFREIIQKMTSKSQFPKPIQYLDEWKLVELLILGKELRISNLSVFNPTIEKIKWKTSIFNRLIKIFSKA